MTAHGFNQILEGGVNRSGFRWSRFIQMGDLLLEDFFLCGIFREPAQIEQSESFPVRTHLPFPFFSFLHLRHAW